MAPEPPVPAELVARPVALACSAGGRMAVLDRGGDRLVLSRRDAEPLVLDLDARALSCRFRGEAVALLGADAVVRSLDPDGAPRGAMAVRAGAVAFGFAPSGSLVVGYGRRGRGDHGVTLERFGDAPATYADEGLHDAVCLAVETGGVWLAGTGAVPPTVRAMRLRPVADGFATRGTVALPRPPRAATIGPDGALYVVLEPGDAIVRVAGHKAGAPVRLDATTHDLARGERVLWGCGPRGIVDLTHVVPPATDRPDPELPACSP